MMNQNDQTLQLLETLAFSNIVDFVEFGTDGKIALKEFPQHKGLAIKEITLDSRGHVARLKLHNKTSALKLLGQLRHKA